MPACTRSRQVAHLDVRKALPAETLRRGINDALPADIHVLAVDTVPHRFHARHGAVARSYLYQVSRRRSAFAKPFVWWVREPLDLDRMKAAADALHRHARLPGLQRRRSGGEIDRRPGRRCDARRGRRLDPRCASAARTSSGRWCAAWSACSSRSARDNSTPRTSLVCCPATRKGLPSPAALTAPASGLFLERVFYDGDPRPLAAATGGACSPCAWVK